MPVIWSDTPNKPNIRSLIAVAGPGQPILTLTLTHHNALTRPGFAWFIGVTAVLMLIPLLAFIGSVFLWILLLSLGTALASMWIALRLSWHRGHMREGMVFYKDKITLKRTDPNGSQKHWEANPYWVQAVIDVKDGPVPNYLTLRGGDREVELGSFLSEDERPELAENLRQVLDCLAEITPTEP